MTNIQTIADRINSKVLPTQKRFSLTRESYINSLPPNHEVYAYEQEVVVAYTYVSRRGYPSLMLFSGRGNKPIIHSAYRTEEQRSEAIINVLENIRSSMKRIEERKKQRSAPHSLQVGDILVSSWGYDQTNIDYYQVTKLIGSTMVEIHPIYSRIVDNHGTYDVVMPVKDGFIQPRHDGDTWKCKPLRRKVDPVYNGVSINTFASAYKWDGKPQDETNSMFGR